MTEAISPEAREAVVRWKFEHWQKWEKLIPRLRADVIQAWAADFVRRALGSGALQINLLDGRFECDWVVARNEHGHLASLVRIKTWIANIERVNWFDWQRDHPAPVSSGFLFPDVARLV